jgi:copper transport protein
VNKDFIMNCGATLRRPWSGRQWAALLVAIVVFAGLLQPGDVSAHAAYDSSQPKSGEVVSTAPTEITVRFTEHLDRSYSRLELFDQAGTEVSGTELVDGDDDFSMTLRLPPDMPNGTYSVLWRTLSSDDGHTAQNYFAFTIGSDADIATVVVPSESLSAGDAPQWAKTVSRWLALIGLAMLMAVWPLWNIVLRPALRPVWRSAPDALRRVHRFAIAAVVAAIVGTLIALLVQALTLDEGNALERVLNTLGQTRYGRLALFRLGLFLVLGLILSISPWWFRNRRKVESGLAWIVTILLPLPFSLIAHAFAQPSGRNVAIGADYLHLLGFGIWGGGLAMLMFVLLPVIRQSDAAQRRAVLSIALPRFSAIALISWAVLGLTGFYAGWLEVGNLTALRDTNYGKALIVKLAFLVVVLILAAYNLLVISRKINDGAGPIWSKRLRWTIGGELVFLLIAIIAVGQLTSLQPARDQIVEESNQVTVPFDLAGTNARLLIGPGTTGVNHFRLEVGGPELDTSVEMLLRLTMPAREDLGTKEITLSRVAGNAFEHHGSELSISGDWQLKLIERISGKAPLEAEAALTVSDVRTGVDVPGNPWRFETLGGITGLLLLVFGIGGLVLAWFAGRTPMRKESAGLAVAALALGIILLLQARIDPILANSRGGSAIDTSDLPSIPATWHRSSGARTSTTSNAWPVMGQNCAEMDRHPPGCNRHRPIFRRRTPRSTPMPISSTG